jgi:hypothetical protein
MPRFLVFHIILFFQRGLGLSLFIEVRIILERLNLWLLVQYPDPLAPSGHRGGNVLKKTRCCFLILTLIFFVDIAQAAGPEEIAIWKEFVALLRKDAMSLDRIRPASPLTPESQLALLKDFAKRADWDEWEAAPEAVRYGNYVSFIVTLGKKQGSPWSYTFNFVVENGRWYYRFLEGIYIRLDKVTSFPADASSFPDRTEEDKHWMRQEAYWSEQVALFNLLTRELGKDGAWRWVRGELSKGVGYALAATTWVPFFPTHRSFILFLCWEQAKLWGDKVTLEKLDEHEAVVRFDDLTYFALYQRASHLKQQISREDYIKIFETIWQERAQAAGWKLSIDGKGRQIFLRFSR